MIVRLILGALAATLAAACAQAQDPTPTLAMCGSDNDCGSTVLRCIAPGWCVAKDAPETKVAVVLSAPSGSALAQTTYEQKVGDGHFDALPMTLVKPAEVSVLVQVKGLGVAVTGTIVATADSDVPGVPLYAAASAMQVTQPLATPTKEQESWNGRLYLQKGRTYQLAFFPDAASIAPSFESLTVTGDMAYKIEFPIQDKQWKATGTLITGGKPAVGARVWLQAKNAPFVSTAATTGADGSFALWLSDKVKSKHTFRLEVEPGTPDAWVPQTGVDLPDAVTAVTQLGMVAVPALPPKKLVTIAVQDASGAPVPSAFVQVRAKGLAGGAKWQTQANTGPAGSVTLALPALEVALVALPPQTSKAARTKLNAKLGAQDAPDTITVTCGVKQALNGHVLDWNGKPVAGASVLLQHTASANSVVPPDELAIEPSAMVTAADGSFATWLDPGQYRAVVDPPAGSGFPRFVMVLPAGPEVTIALPVPVLCSGAVVDQSGDKVQKVAGITVDIYAITAAKRSAGLAGDEADDKGQETITRLLATTKTDAEGRYKVVIAPP